MTQSLPSKRPKQSAAAAWALLVTACLASSSCLESLPPDLDPQHLSLVAAPPGSSFEGLYKWAATTMTISGLPNRRYRIRERSSDGSVTEWTARFVALDPETSGLTPQPGAQAYIAVLTDRTPPAGLLGALYYVLVYDGQSDGYIWRDIEIRDETRMKAEAALQKAGLTLVSSPRLRLVKRGGGAITGTELRALPVAELPLGSVERLERIRPTEPVAAESPRPAPERPAIAGTYAAAPFVTPKRFMQEVREVRLIVNAKTEDVQVPMAAWRSIVEHHLNRRGITVNDRAPITAAVSLTHLRLALTGQASEILVELDFEVPAPVFRGGSFIAMRVSPASSFRWYVWLGDGYALANTLRDQFSTCIDQMLDVIYADDPSERAPDRRSRWSTTSAVPLNDRFNSAVGVLSTRVGYRTLAGLRSFPEIRVDLDAEAGQFLSQDEVRQRWRNEFGALGLQANEGIDWMIRHSIVAAVQNVRGRTIHHCLDVREVFQRDVVYPLNGRIVRSDVRITWSHTLAYCSQGKERAKLEGLVGESARALADEWRRAQVR
jgi:hypothetical protein